MIEFITLHWHTVIALAATGVFAGLLAGLLGVGGGIVIVPVLFFLFQGLGITPDTAMVVATATSLATIVPTSISAIRAHYRKGNVDTHLLRHWAIFIFLGVIVGSWLVTRVDGTVLTLLFGIVAILSALNMLFRTGKSALFIQLPSRGGQSVMASVIGFLSAMVGIGGGTLSVPLLTLYNYPAHKAVGTALAIGLLISLPAALILLLMGTPPADAPVGTYGLVNMIGFACIVPLTVLVAPLGATIASQLDAVKLKRIFAVVLLITGIRMLVQVFL